MAKRIEYYEPLKAIESILSTLEKKHPCKNLSLGKKQERFSMMFAGLMIKAFYEGFDIRLGETYDDDGNGHIKNSTHYKKLAGDVNLFENGEFLQKTSDHQKLGEWWEQFGGSWGGRFNDGNHYSISDGGVK